MANRRSAAMMLAAAVLTAAAGSAMAADQTLGVSDSEIKVGNTMPYSGPASGLGTLGKAEAAYFAMINDRGGVNGRKINFITRDDGYSPPKTLEVTRHLVEEQQVLLMFSGLGTATNTAVQDYLNEAKVPQLFIATGAAKWNDPKRHPLDHGVYAELPDRGEDLWPLYPAEPPRRQDRGALSE
jgi:branched-chain amino acid transport system substrate-binding protein